MIAEVLFVCTMGQVTKEIKLETVKETRVGKICEVYIDDKSVGYAKHNSEFCSGLASKVKMDMEKKGYQCSEKVHD